MTNAAAQKDDTYGAWVERVAAGRDGKPLSPGELVEPGPPEPFASVEFVRVEYPLFVGEVGKRGDDYIFHFFPKTAELAQFEEKMGDVFLAVFKNPNQVQAAFTIELGSWAVKVTGFANTVWGDDQALSIFDKLDAALAK